MTIKQPLVTVMRLRWKEFTCVIWFFFRFELSHFNLVTHMSEYSIRPGGSLKLKGGVAEGGVVKK